jgi:hypothetical protein
MRDMEQFDFNVIFCVHSGPQELAWFISRAPDAAQRHFDGVPPPVLKTA